MTLRDLLNNETLGRWAVTFFLVVVVWHAIWIVFHVCYMLDARFVLVTQVNLNNESVWELLSGLGYEEAYRLNPRPSMLVNGLYYANSMDVVLWPWWTCPMCADYVASFKTFWNYICDLPVWMWICGRIVSWFLFAFAMFELGRRCFSRVVRVPSIRINVSNGLPGRTLAGPILELGRRPINASIAAWTHLSAGLNRGRQDAGAGARARDLSPARLPPPDPLPQGFVKACGNCSRNKGCGKPNNGTTTTLHKHNGEWPDLPVPAPCPPAQGPSS